MVPLRTAPSQSRPASPRQRHDQPRRGATPVWWRPLLALLALLLAIPAAAAVPGTTQIEGLLLAAGGTPAADGSYKLTLTLWDAAQAGNALWTELADVTITAGRFSWVAGASTPIPASALASGKVWLGVKVGADPELPRQALTATPYAMRAGVASSLECSGCIGASAAGFNYAASTTKGGAALDLACTGCVSVAELNFDGDVDLGGNSIKAKNGTFAGDVVAKTVTATSFVGDGSKLTGIKTASGSCKSGEAVTGIGSDGSLVCKAVAAGAPADGIAGLSAGLLSNQFVDAQGAQQSNVAIPDNTGSDATSLVSFPDLGEALAITVTVQVTNTDLSTVRVRLLPPNDKKVGYTLCDPCGDKDAKSLKASWSDKIAPKSGDLAAWIGGNPKGDWTLLVTDSSYCLPQAPGNGALCDLTKKTDGVIVDWSVEAKTISTKKVAATSSLQLQPLAAAPLPCTENHMGTLYFDKASKSLRYCDGSVWRTLADTCGNGILESNEQCDDGNNTDGDGCSSTCQTVCGDGKKVGNEQCDDGNKVDTDGCTNACQPGYGTVKDKPGTSCLDILTKYAAGGGKATDGSYWIATPKNGDVVAVQCDMTTEGGGYTYFPVDSGIVTSRSTDNDTCKTYGLNIVYPRSKAQWTWMLAKFGSGYFATIPGVTKSGNGGNYTGCVMRDPASYGSGCNDWKVGDGGRWWLRDSTYSEPNGDYDANCWLSMYNYDANNIQFNDGSCSYSTSKYLCSTNDKK